VYVLLFAQKWAVKMEQKWDFVAQLVDFWVCLGSFQGNSGVLGVFFTFQSERIRRYPSKLAILDVCFPESHACQCF